MKILSSNIHLDAQRHHQVEQRAQLEVSLEKGGDTYTLSQEWERREEQSSTTQQTSQMSRDLSSDVQQKSLQTTTLVDRNSVKSLQREIQM